MEMTDFIEKLAEQFDDVDAGLLTTETKFMSWMIILPWWL